jgi:chorismate mutase/prephenate dehydratase
MAKQALYYLGPQGTFTHQAAADAERALQAYAPEGTELIAAEDVPAIIRMVQGGRGWGVIAWENNVEGYVVPNLDALIDVQGVAGFARIGADIAFDAFTLADDPAASPMSPVAAGSVAGSDDMPRNDRTHNDQAHEGQAASATPNVDAPARLEVSAHPHGLAQCRRFIERYQLLPVPATSNAAACRDLKPGRIALGPAICGPLYGLHTFAEQVQDYQGARTEFLVLGPRDEAPDLLQAARAQGVAEFESIIAFIPLSTGPGVLANLLDVLRDAGLNMTSFISRPIKGHDGTYSFIATIDAAPWQDSLCEVLAEVVDHGDWVKTLAVYPRRERPNPPVDAWMLPTGGVHVATGAMPAAVLPAEAMLDEDAQRNDMQRGEVRQGASRRETMQRGEVQRGEVQRGERQRGEVQRGEAQRGEAPDELAEPTELFEPSEAACEASARTRRTARMDDWQHTAATRRELLW